MKKILIPLIIVVSIASFTVAVYFGFKFRKGVPVETEEVKRPILEVTFIDNSIDLKKGIDQSFWEKIPSQSIKLMYQVMVLPWPKAVRNEAVTSIEVKAFHNKRDIYFYLEWEDSTEDRIIDVNKFSDAGAIMFPLGEATQLPSLMMGFLVKANIWHWKASKDREYWFKENAESKTYVDFYYPFEGEELFVVSRAESPSAVNDLLAVRVGTVTSKPYQKVEGRGFSENSRWKVVFRRTLEVSDPEVDAQFDQTERLAAFAVWNGSKGDRGGRKSISDWVNLKIQ